MIIMIILPFNVKNAMIKQDNVALIQTEKGKIMLEGFRCSV